MSTSNDSPTSSSFWIGKKPSTHKLWYHINDYISNYTAEFRHEVESKWFQKWSFLINDIKINNKRRDFQEISLSLTSNPGTYIEDCINAVVDLVPTLCEHFSSIKVNL